MSRARDRRRTAALLLGALLSACTLLVDSELDKHLSTGGPDSGSPDSGPDSGSPDSGPDSGSPDSGPDSGSPDSGVDAGCDDLGLSDGTPDASFTFHSGVLGVAFTGPPAPAQGFEDPNLYASSLVIRLAGATWIAGANPGGSGLNDVSYGADYAVPLGSHQGPGNYLCTEVLLGVFDGLRSLTRWSFEPLSCGEGSTDGGVTAGAPAAQAPSLGVLANPDGGVGSLGVLFGASGATCLEQLPFGCFPPDGGAPGFGGGARQLLGLRSGGGAAVWAVAEGPPASQVTLYDSAFHALDGGALGGGAVISGDVLLVPLSYDVAVALAVQGSTLRAQVFDSTGALLGPVDTFDLLAAGTGLQATSLPGARVRVTWRDDTGTVHTARVDFSVPSAPVFGSLATVCGGSGKIFAAPLSDTLIAVLGASQDLYFRPAPP